jgi:thiamine monophosphate kinase
MIDVSDGLSTDLSHILEESKVSARIYKDRIPAAAGTGEQHVLHGGEEYELIIVGNEFPAMIEGVPLTCIGEIIESKTAMKFVYRWPSESVLQPHGGNTSHERERSHAALRHVYANIFGKWSIPLLVSPMRRGGWQ